MRCFTARVSRSSTIHRHSIPQPVLLIAFAFFTHHPSLLLCEVRAPQLRASEHKYLVLAGWIFLWMLHPSYLFDRGCVLFDTTVRSCWSDIDIILVLPACLICTETPSYVCTTAWKSCITCSAPHNLPCISLHLTSLTHDCKWSSPNDHSRLGFNAHLYHALHGHIRHSTTTVMAAAIQGRVRCNMPRRYTRSVIGGLCVLLLCVPHGGGTSISAAIAVVARLGWHVLDG